MGKEILELIKEINVLNISKDEVLLVKLDYNKIANTKTMSARIMNAFNELGIKALVVPKEFEISVIKDERNKEEHF